MIQTIKQWRADERPREKMFSKGCESLTAAEIIAILIRSGNRNDNAVVLAGKILDMAGGSLTNLSRMTVESLCRIDGIGQAKALSVLAAAELGRRIAGEKIGGDPIRNSLDIAQVMIPHLKGLQHEEFWVMYLNSGRRLIGKEKLSTGGTASTVADVKMIVRSAVEKMAAGIVLIHNHPSGDPHPGMEDIRRTSEIRQAAACLDISLIDHIIVGGDKYFSFSDENY